MPYLPAGVLALLAVALVVRLAAEWRRYTRGEHIISRQQMGLRVASAGDLMLLLVLVAVGARMHFSSFAAAVAYWGLCLLLAVGAIALAGWDLRLLGRVGRQRRAESYRRLSAYIRRLERSREGEEPGP